MQTQQYTVFLNADTYEILMRLRREGGYGNDDELLKAALHALDRGWHQSYQYGPREDVVTVTEEIIISGAARTPEDYDT